MNKIIFSFVILLCFLQQSSVVAQLVTTDEKSKEQQPFPLALLPKDLQNLITSYMWAVGDSPDEFKQIALKHNKNKTIQSQLTTYNPVTSRAEGKKYGFHGEKIPINFYTGKDNNSSIINVGCIIERAVPSSLNGYSYLESHVETTRIFLDGPSGIYTTSITNGQNENPTILACSLSVHGDLAIAWEDKDDSSYVTFSKLTEVKQGKPIDLGTNKVLAHSSTSNGDTLNTILFNRQGTLLTSISNNLACHNEKDINYIPTPNNNTTLTPAQICKRMILPIAGAQDLVREKNALAKQQKEKKKSSWLDLLFGKK